LSTETPPTTPTKKTSVLVAPEEYSSGNEEYGQDDTTSEMAAISITSIPPSSLFESPNENRSNNNAKFLMAKTSKDYSSRDEEHIHEDTSSEEATSASTPLTSLFECPNENLSINVNKCFMFRTTMVAPPSKPISNISDNLVGDLERLKIK
jgi:hypothetical protein